ncbi:IspD/TarI family cytidylyltransferase [Actinophytocola xanthii]|uniref:2-C-methyl-D-erythritol 4-phosphate cytidylyltransferase n=1 Tax=Actinophytocola xanthii TaxID=1912961 RepID=A0A1Q8C907_9PSEU|nr:IspD/TarI family cytidylyltransferase [Actinophytocola xanthii]OLF10840.1 2-C-methyl-D-erythritol 4-phosphate cytidylyltransferase [Actinophytocola xanthii]
MRRRTPDVPYAAGVVLAGGSGTRMGAGMNKAYLPLAGRRLASWSLLTFGQVPEVGVLVLVARPEDAEHLDLVLSSDLPGTQVELVHGGDTRQDSELAALRHLSDRVDDGTIDVILLHDAARPLVRPALVTEVVEAAREHGGAVPGLPAEDLVTGAGTTVSGAPLEGAVRAQTPQGFRAAALVDAYEQAAREGFLGTDTASCMERYSSLPVRWVRGDEHNFKITYPHDLTVAERLLDTSVVRQPW